MLPTPRAIRTAAVLAATALVVLLLGGGATFAIAFAGAAGLLVAVLVADVLTLPRTASWQARRDVPESCGLGRELERVVRVDLGPRAAGRRAELREAFPATCIVAARSVDGELVVPAVDDPTGGADRARLDGDGRARFVRRYLPQRRGPQHLGDLRLRVGGRFGWVERDVRLGGEQAFDVEPALVGLSRTLALAASERWQDLGVRRLRRVGGRTEFESLRDYVRGDDPRQLDWKATARRGKATVRQFEEERGQELVLLVDCGRRMRATAESGANTGWTKLDWALDAVLQLAAVALARGDRVGCLAFDDRVLAFEAPLRGSRQLQRLRRALFDQQPSTRESDYGHALRALAVRHRRRALVLIVSDVADPLSLDAQRRALATAARRHRVVFAALDDPLVRRLADGEGPGDDPGSAPKTALEAAPIATDGLPGAALRAVAIDLDEDRRSALRGLSGGGARVVSALPAEAAAPLLAAWLSARGR